MRKTLKYVPVIGSYAGGASAVCAGSTNTYGDGCTATQALTPAPWSSTSDAQGNLYFSDTTSNRVRRIDAKTGIITTVAGGGPVCAAKTNSVGDGCPATQAVLTGPHGVAFDLWGNLTIADGTANNRIRSVDAKTGIITTIAGNGTAPTTPPSNASTNIATATGIGNPFAIAFDALGNLYMSNGAQSAMLMVQATNGKFIAGTSRIYNLAGTGTRGYNGDNILGTTAQLFQNRGVWIGPDQSIYIADFNNFRVRKVVSPFVGGTLDLTRAIITTVAGNGTNNHTGDGGPATAATIASDADVFMDNANNLYFTTYFTAAGAIPAGDYVRSVNLNDGTLSAFAGIGTRVQSGDGGASAAAGLFGTQSGGNYDRFGDIFVDQSNNGIIRRISSNGNFLMQQAVGTTSAAQNVGLQALTATKLSSAVIDRAMSGEFALGAASGCSVGGALTASAYCYLPLTFSPNYPGLRTARLRVKDPADAFYSLGLTGNGVAAMPVFGAAKLTTLAGNGTAGSSGDNAAAAAAKVSNPQGVTIDGQGNIYFADTGNNSIRRIDVNSGNITTVAGNGTAGNMGDGAAATDARLSGPTTVAVDAAGNLYIADTGNNVIRFVNTDTGFISTIAGTGTSSYSGDGGLATAATLFAPQGVFVDAGGNVYVADTGNHVVRRFGIGGAITTIAGTGTSGTAGDNGPASLAQLNTPVAITFDMNGSYYIVDSGAGTVRKVDTFGQISTIAGTAGIASGNAGDGGAATAATLNAPSSVAIDAAGDVFIGTVGTVRLVDTNGTINTVVGTTASGTFSGEGGPANAAVLGSANISVALGANGNVAIADSSANRVLQVASSTPAAIDFGVHAAGTSSAVVVIPVLNSGNDNLTFTALAASANFTLGTGTDACTSATALAPGKSCTLSIQFTPAVGVTGSVTGTVVLTNNALNVAGNKQTIDVSGSTNIVLTTTTAVTFTPASPTYGASVAAKATITGGTTPGGTVTFSVGATQIGSPVAVTSASAQITLPALPAGASNVTAVYSGDAANKSSTGTASVTVAPASLIVTANNATKAQSEDNPTFTYAIIGFVNGDTAATAVSGVPSLITTATAASTQGSYPITAVLGTLTSANYTFTFVNGTLTVGPPPPADFTLTVTPTSLTVVDGQNTTGTVSLKSLHDYNGTAQLSCVDQPKNVVCSFAALSLKGDPAAAGATVSTTVNISTDNSQHISANRMQELLFKRIGLPTMALLIFCFGRNRRRLGQVIKLAILLLITAGASSCANDLGKDVAVPGTYTFSVKASDGSLSKTVPVTIIIN